MEPGNIIKKTSNLYVPSPFCRECQISNSGILSAFEGDPGIILLMGPNEHEHTAGGACPRHKTQGGGGAQGGQDGGTSVTRKPKHTCWAGKTPLLANSSFASIVTNFVQKICLVALKSAVPSGMCKMLSICLWVKVSRTSHLPTIKRPQLLMSVKHVLKLIKLLYYDGNLLPHHSRAF